MNTKKADNRKPKKNGIKGRTSEKDLSKRLKICRNLFNDNPPMSKQFFLTEYKRLLDKEALAIPTDQTLIKDANKCNITFQNGTSQTNIYTMFNYLGHLLSPEIRQIRFTSKTYDTILLNIRTYSFEISKFKEKTANVKKNIENPKKNYLNHTIAYLSFILLDTGMENYIEHVFSTELHDSDAFLYIEKCCYCVKIYFELKHYDTIMSKVFEIVEELEPNENS